MQIKPSKNMENMEVRIEEIEQDKNQNLEQGSEGLKIGESMESEVMDEINDGEKMGANNGQVKKHLIIDTSYLLFRSYFAYPHLTTNGKNTGAIFGFFKSLISTMSLIQPDSVYFALDLPKSTWRHDIHDGYKAGRAPMEEGMKEQIPQVLNLIKKATKNVIGVEGFEADDVIYTLSQKLYGEVYIFSSDKDLYQLFTKENIKFIRSHKGIISFFDHPKFMEEYEVEPNLWVDFKALVGDKSDNLAGVIGIGPKTAALILKETGGLGNLFESLGLNADILKNSVLDKNFKQKCDTFVDSEKGRKLVEKILNDKEKLIQTYELARLQIVPDVELNEINPNFNLIFNDFLEYNFKNLISQMQKNGLMNKDLKMAEKKVNLVEDENALF